jgi:hypothetical protein
MSRVGGNKFFRFLLLWALILGALPLGARALPPRCETVLSSYTPSQDFPARKLAETPTLRVGTYNLYNLFEYQGKFTYDRHGDRSLEVAPAYEKDPAKLSALADAILLENPDVLVCQEVESIKALELFNYLKLRNQYRVFLIEGNDSRGIDVAFLVKKDLPLDVRMVSHREFKGVDPLKPNEGEIKIFSRDLPILELRQAGAKATSKPLLSIFGTHYKSKRSRPGDKESRKLREAQVQATIEVIREYEKLYGPNFPYLLAGDFNGEANREKEFAELFKALGMEDPFNVVEPLASRQDRVTHSFHPKGESTKYSQIDHIMVSSFLARYPEILERIFVHRYRDAQGRLKPLPRDYEEREKNPSDHFPVFLDISLPFLLNLP